MVGAEPPRVTWPAAQEGRPWPEAKEAPGLLLWLFSHPWLAALVVVGAQAPWVQLVGLGPEALEGRPWPEAKEALGGVAPGLLLPHLPVLLPLLLPVLLLRP